MGDGKGAIEPGEVAAVGTAAESAAGLDGDQNATTATAALVGGRGQRSGAAAAAMDPDICT